jgi:hypothetical protein
MLHTKYQSTADRGGGGGGGGEKQSMSKSVNSPSLKEKPKKATFTTKLEIDFCIIIRHRCKLSKTQKKLPQSNRKSPQFQTLSSERPLNSLAQKKPISASERAMEKAQIPNTRYEHEISGRYYCH